jgi:hypothetical protein
MRSLLRPKTPAFRRERRATQPARVLSIECLEDRAVPAVVALPDIAMLAVTTHDSKSVTFQYSIANASVKSSFSVAIYRAPRATFQPANDIKIGEKTFLSADGSVGTHTFTLTITGGLPIDPAHPFVLAVANPTRSVVESDAQSDTNDVASFRTFVVGAVAHGYEATPGLPAWVNGIAKGLTHDGYDVAIPFNWSSTSNTPLPGQAVAAGLKLANEIAKDVAKLPLGPNDVIDLQLIGHSRGAVVISQAALDLQAMEQASSFSNSKALRSGFLKLTFLDPHPANNGNPQQAWYSASGGSLGRLGLGLYTQFQAAAQDPQVVIPSNASDTEVYYQHASHLVAPSIQEKFVDVWGQVPISGAVTHYCDLTGIVNGHYEVPDWYLAHVVPTLKANGAFVCPGKMGTPSAAQIRASSPPISGGADFEVQALFPKVVTVQSLAVSIENQLAAAEGAIVLGDRPLALSRLKALAQLISSESGKHIDATTAKFVVGLLNTVIAAL